MSGELCRIATRRSPLAVRQAELIAEALTRGSSLRIALVRVQTEGDRMLEHPLASIGGKGLFVKELESCLLQGKADLAVHSMKDLPAELPDGLAIVAIPEREDPRDAILTRDHASLQTLPDGARVGTSSLRRKAQLQTKFPNLTFTDMRGNIGTRLEKLKHGQVAALVLACAGLKRLGYAQEVTQILDPQECLPAIGQGALGVEAAVDHPHARRWTEKLHHPETAAAVAAERAVSRALSGSCQTPLAAYAVCTEGGRVHLRACLARPDGSQVLYADVEDEPEAAGAKAAQQLLDQGGGEILAALGVSPSP